VHHGIWVSAGDERKELWKADESENVSRKDQGDLSQQEPSLLLEVLPAKSVEVFVFPQVSK